MNDTIAGNRIQQALGIRPEETPLVALLFGNMFMSGIAIGLIRVCAFTLFLANFDSEQLALVAILLAITGIPVTLAIDRLTHGFSVGAYLFTILGTILTGLLVFSSILSISDNRLLIFSLPLFFEIVYMLFSLQFIALLTRLLNVRQTKRLSGIARSGEFLAELVGGLSVAFLLNYMEVKDLLLVAAVALLGVFAIVQLTLMRFKGQLSLTSTDLVHDEIDSRLLGLLRMPYVRLIGVSYAAYIFAYFFLDVAFYKYAAVQFPSEHELAAFIGQFFAVIGLITLLVMVFLFAPFLRRFGILAGVIAFPIVVGIGSTAVSAMEISGVTMTAIFAVMVITNGMRFILQSAIWRPSVAILFHVLPDRQRIQGTALIEGVIDPLSGGLAGLCLYLLSNYLQWEPKYFLLILSALMIVWISLGMIIRRMYLSTLVVSIQKRKLGQISLQELDNASLDLIKQGLRSDYPSEVFYCLNLLEEIEHPEFTELIKDLLLHDNQQIRLDTLQRIARLKIHPLTQHVLARITNETDSHVRGQALMTYADLAPDDVITRLAPFLEDEQRDLRKGALVGILSFRPKENEALDYLLALVRSIDAEDRIIAADVMGETKSTAFSGFLVELLDDKDAKVVQHAIQAAGLMRDNRLINPLVSKISHPGLQGPTSHALRQYGERALYDLDLGISSPAVERQDRLHMLDIVAEIGGVEAVDVFLRQLTTQDPAIKHQIYLGLAHLHYQALADDKYMFVNLLDQEVQFITLLLAAMEDLHTDARYALVHAALGSELELRRDNMLLLISFLFPSIVMLDTRANIDSRVSELRVFALEVLENLLTTEIKQVVLPILDDISNAERLQALSELFPQTPLAADERFNNLMEEHLDSAFYWTRSALLYQVGQQKNKRHLSRLQEAVDDREIIIRETALWSLHQLNPPDLHNILVAHQDDPSPSIKKVVSELLLDLQTGEDTDMQTS
ncbi:MAG: AAA family ATP:ADP antiporter [Candidatus Azotimanducaceae bacterium]